MASDSEQIIIVNDGIQLLDATTYQPVIPPLYLIMANQVEWRPDGTQVAIHAYHRIYILDSQTLAVLYSSERTPYPARGISWSPDGTRLAYSGADGTLKIVPVPVTAAEAR